ncbi:MAG TPA: hypothetical protein VLA51_10755 [Paracoccaceae bacterium]|nr:hypothetical protein [Paracoccaceae bacterium]
MTFSLRVPFKALSVLSALITCAALSPHSALAEAVIDMELSGHVDFRDVAYSGCLDKVTCTVGDITLIAQRRDVSSNELETASPDAEQPAAPPNTQWRDARLYWDPIDGIGVREGAQNDEVDFDERIVAAFKNPVTVTKIWFSDMFTTEDDRYGSGSTDRVEGVAEDTETAGFSILSDGVVQNTFVVEANDRLPWASFNQEIDWRFREGGDLDRRVVIDGEFITIIAPGANASGRLVEKRFAIGEIDPEKKDIFEGVETVEIDLTDILAEFNNTPLFEQGSTNFNILRSLAEDPEALLRLRNIAETKRETIRMSNGEVGWTLETATQGDELQFFAPFDASNDFSISGIILQR